MLPINPFFIADIIGIVFFTISGALVAIKNHLDLLGLFIAAFLTALGGGVIRDILLDRTPLSFVLIYPSLTVFLTLLAVFIFRLQTKADLEQRWFFVLSDTIGLVAFSIAGALLAIQAHLNVFAIVIIAFTTAVGGGLIRDVLINKIPEILVSSFYGSIAIVVALLLFFLKAVELLNSYTIFATALFAVILRLLAFYRKWHLPTIA